MLDGKINIASISDIHLGHKKTPTAEILTSLYGIFKDNVEMAELDIIWFCGDTFDQLLYLPENHIGDIQIWMTYLLKLCHKHNVILRILEGTPSHDRKQSKQFTIINEMLNIDADVKYIDDLIIEHIPKLDINVLYIPDEFRGTTEETKVIVQDTLLRARLTHVDFAIMHGMFEYQLPKNVSMQYHDIEYYTSIVNCYIFIGHIHKMSQVGKVVVAGSTGRLAHNEEEDKGHWRISIDVKNNLNKLTFVINELATIYKTFDLLDLESVNSERIITKMTSMVKGSNVRFILNKGDILPNELAVFCNNNRNIRFTEKRVNKITADNNERLQPNIYKPSVVINPNSVSDLIESRLLASGINPELLLSVKDILREHV